MALLIPFDSADALSYGFPYLMNCQEVSKRSDITSPIFEHVIKSCLTYAVSCIWRLHVFRRLCVFLYKHPFSGPRWSQDTHFSTWHQKFVTFQLVNRSASQEAASFG